MSEGANQPFDLHQRQAYPYLVFGPIKGYNSHLWTGGGGIRHPPNNVCSRSKDARPTTELTLNLFNFVKRKRKGRTTPPLSQYGIVKLQ